MASFTINVAAGSKDQFVHHFKVVLAEGTSEEFARQIARELKTSYPKPRYHVTLTEWTPSTGEEISF